VPGAGGFNLRSFGVRPIKVKTEVSTLQHGRGGNDNFRLVPARLFVAVEDEDKVAVF
jgi:hypothetical protein